MDRLITEIQASEKFNIKLSTWRNWRYKGEGPPYIKLNNRLVRYSEADLQKYFTEHRIDPGRSLV